MATTKKYLTRIPNGGFNRAFLPHASKPEEFHDLLQFRPLVGGLQQTAPIVQKQALSLLNGEAATSQTVYLDQVWTANGIDYLLIGENYARLISPSNLATQAIVPVFINATGPTANTVWSQALMTGFNLTDFANVNDTYTVTVDSTSTIKWRLNTGAWTSGVPIAATVPIASGLVLHFMVDSGYTGFTVGATWAWQRVTAFAPFGMTTAGTTSVNYLSDVYISNLGINATVYRFRDGHIDEVGYQGPTYGKYVAVFANHLVVAGFNAGTGNQVFTVSWSHLNDPDQFFPTSNNEADSYLIPYSGKVDMLKFGITGMQPMYSSLYIYTPDAMYKMDYVGLPDVMQTVLVWDKVGSYFPFGLVATKQGHYFISRDNFYSFIGFRPKAIGEAVREKFFSEVVNSSDPYFEYTTGYYDVYKQEVIWTYYTKVGANYQAKQVVYMEKYDRWYFRNLPSSGSGATDLTAMTPIYGDTSRFLYGGDGFLYSDYNNELITTIATDFSGFVPAYTAPYAETNDLYYQDIYFQKEADTLYIDAGWYTSVSGVQAGVSARQLLSAGVTYANANQLWTMSTPEGRVGLPKPSTHGRILRFQFSFVPAAGACPIGCMLNAWGDNNYERSAER